MTTTPKPLASVESNRHFRTDHLMGDLKGRSVRGGAITMAAQACKFVLQMGSTMILARLLTPDDFGLLAMVTVLTGFVLIFKDAGLSMATIQRADVNHQQVSTVFWLNVSVSCALVGVVAGSAPLLAWLYGRSELVGITLVLSVMFLFGGLTVQHQALLRRQMRFTALAAIDVAAIASGIAVAIVMALGGYGYWSLVGMMLAPTVVNCVFAWVCSGWVPGRPTRAEGVSEMVGFGANLTASKSLHYFARSGDNFLIGLWFGASALGLYSKAYNLLLLPINQLLGPISGVIVPALARLQNEPSRYRHAFRQVYEAIAMVAIPAAVLLALLAKPVTLVILGQQWVEAATIFAWLSIAALYFPLASAANWLFISQGRGREMMVTTAINSTIAVASFVVGLPWGPAGVAGSFAMTGLVLRLPIQFFACGRRGPVTQGDLWRGFLLNLPLPLGIGAILLGLQATVEVDQPLLELVVFGLLGVAGILGSMLLVPVYRRRLIHLLNQFKAI